MFYYLGVQLFWSWFYLLVLMIIWCAVKNWAMHSGLEIHNLEFNIDWPHLRRIDEYHMISIIHPIVFVQLTLCTSALCIEKYTLNQAATKTKISSVSLIYSRFFQVRSKRAKAHNCMLWNSKRWFVNWCTLPFQMAEAKYFLYRL